MSTQATLNLLAVPPRLSRSQTFSVSVLQIASDLGRKFGDGTAPPSSESLNAIAQRLVQHLSTGSRPDKRLWRKAPWCLWSSTPAISSDSNVLQKFMLMAQDSLWARRSFVRTLATVYLTDFSEKQVGLEGIREILKARKHDLTPALLNLFEATNDFDPKNGPRQLAMGILTQRGALRESLKTLGLSPMVSMGGFAVATGAVGLRMLSLQLRQSKSIAEVDAIERFISVNDGEQQFSSLNSNFISALLQPFADVSPSLDVRTRVIDLAVAKYGDPRVYTERWHNNNEERATLSKWLDEQSLRLFLDIVDQTALAEHWKYRRAFWEAWWKKGYVENAWVVFGPDGFARARRQLGKDVQFARLVEGGRGTGYIYDNHSVLLLRIGDLIIADWSHNSKCYIWKDENKQAPSIYDQKYLAGALRTGFDFDKSHSSPKTYSWQRDVNEFIRKYTNLSLNQADYRVK